MTQSDTMRKALEAARGFIKGQRAYDNIGTSDYTLKIIDQALSQSSPERDGILEEADEWLEASLGLVEGRGPPNWDGIREFRKRLASLKSPDSGRTG